MCGVDGSPLKPLGDGETVLDTVSGRMIKGRYRVLNKLGEGGMGAVYLAEQLSIGRKVALKLLQGNYAKNDEFIARFRREARLAASLNHRNIVTIYDFDQDSDDTLFIAMEYVDGIKLTDVIRCDAPLDVQRAIRLGTQIAEGLHAAHQQGVIHRDIKPDNIMVVGSDDTEEVKLMDFGIARLRDTGVVTHLTMSGMIMGTPTYMAPEQAEGREVSEKTDIYALGIVLYEMLSGSVPFHASTPGAVVMKQIQETPLPLRSLRPEVPASIERVVMQALEKKPESRQQDVREVVQGLKKIEIAAVNLTRRTSLAERTAKAPKVSLTIAATRVSLADRFYAMSGVHRQPMAIALIGMVAIATMVVGVFNFIDREPSHRADQRPRITAEPVRIPEPVIEQVPAKDPEPSAPSLKIAEPVKSVSRPRRSPREKPTQVEKKVDPANVQNEIRLESKDPAQRPSSATKSTPAPISEHPSLNVSKIEYHIRVAKSFRERGEYEEASKELQKAHAIDPNNRQILAEIERTQRACNAERALLGAAGTKC
jgi:serine/threonine protein kinase